MEAATRTDRTFLRHNLLDEDDSASGQIRPTSRRSRRLARKSSHRNVPLYDDPAPHQESTTAPNAVEQRVSIESPAEQSVNQQHYTQPQEPPRARNPFLQQNEAAQIQDPANVVLPPQPDVAGRRERSRRLVIAIDYGTTYTGFAHALVDSDEAKLEDIAVLQDWSTTSRGNEDKVRSLISYSKPVNGEAQWGPDISDMAVSIVNTKLELEPRDTLLDELDTTLHVLQGTHFLAFDKLPKDDLDPEYPYKSPGEIVTDYLSKVYGRVREALGIYKLDQTKTPVDIVLTVPVNWSYEATNSTFKAVREAGFNKRNFPTLKDTILVSEPEAAAYFTAQDIHESPDGDVNFLEADDCFIVCDAGGGTVDVVTLQVKKVTSQIRGARPYLDVKLVTKPTSGKYGSSFIDAAFKQWLRKFLGADLYSQLDPANTEERFNAHSVECGQMRTLIQQFEDRKKTFSSTVKDIPIRLPEPLNRIKVRQGDAEGRIIIDSQQMKKFFRPCVNGVVELIQAQINEVEKVEGRRVRDLFLVGGFGASQYLQEILVDSLRRRCIAMRRPDRHRSLTAVVQGAVIYGIEKSHHKDANCMTAAGRSYGIVMSGNFQWLVRKGDVLLSQQKREVKSHPFWISREEAGAGYALSVYAYRRNADDHVPSLWAHGRYEVETVGSVKCDFARVHDQDLRAGHMHGNFKHWSQTNIGPLRCHLELSPTMLEVKVLCGNICVGENRIKIPTK